MTRAGRIALLMLLLAPLAVAGCRSAPILPNLGTLYQRAAQDHGPTRNPVVVIPGILGSRLEDADGHVVWGAFGGRSASPARPENARRFALPMDARVPFDDGAALTDLRDSVRPTGVLDRVRVRLAGLPLQLRAYLGILHALGIGGYQDPEIADLDYGDDHFTCFQFAYDWRRDNVENAQRLIAFLRIKQDEVRAERIRRFGPTGDGPVRFDVIAHSMGGLMLRYALRHGDAPLADVADADMPPTWAGAPLIERAILIGTPNAGAVDAVRQLVDGRDLGPLLPRYRSALLGTLPSIYQLLPRARHGALIDADTGAMLDPLDPALWRQRGWGLADPDELPVLRTLLPDLDDDARRAAAVQHQERLLHRAARLHDVLDRPAQAPDGTTLYLVAGDAVDTPRALAVDGDGRLRPAGTGPGDGTVLRSSALLDERLDGRWSAHLRSPIRWRQVTFLFSDHLGLTTDPAFTDNVLYLLLEDPR